MTVLVDRFHAALIVLAGHGHIKQRLIKAFEEHISEVRESDLPTELRKPFRELQKEVNQVSPLNGEGRICASVRKMSLTEASECAGRIATLFGEIMRHADDVPTIMPVETHGEERVPPFLVKSV